MDQQGGQGLSSFEIILFQEANVLMRHKVTHQVYRYCQQKQHINGSHLQPYNSTTVAPLIIQKGFLFPTGVADLSHCLSTVVSIQHTADEYQYEQAELVNTLLPVVGALTDLHMLDLVHGSVSPECIFVDQYGQVKIYYPGPCLNSAPYYSQKNPQQPDDFRALAIIILELLGKTKHKEISYNEKLRCLIRSGKFSQKFILTLYLMLNNKQIHGAHIYKLLASSERLSSQLKSVYDIQVNYKDRPQQSKRHFHQSQFTPPLIKRTQQLSPRKMAHPTKKLMKMDDLQNKRAFEEIKKKKPFDTVLKKMSNGKAIQVQNHGISPTYKKILRDIRQTKQRQDLVKLGVTIKRMKTMSKKKLN